MPSNKTLILKEAYTMLDENELRHLIGGKKEEGLRLPPEEVDQIMSTISEGHYFSRFDYRVADQFVVAAHGVRRDLRAESNQSLAHHALFVVLSSVALSQHALGVAGDDEWEDDLAWAVLCVLRLGSGVSDDFAILLDWLRRTDSDVQHAIYYEYSLKIVDGFRILRMNGAGSL